MRDDERKEIVVGVLSKDQILGAQDLKRVFVDVPEWGGGVFVRSLTGAQRDAWEDGWSAWREKLFGNNPTARDWHAYLVYWTACDETGRQLFEESDIPRLQAKSSKALQLIAGVAQKLNGLGAGEIEAAVKNCDGGPSGEPG